MPGAGWAALGAAISGGANAFGQRKHDLIQEQMMKGQLQQQALQQQLLQDQVNELPQKHAEGDMARYTAQFGDDRFNVPGFLAAAKQAGTPLPVKPMMDIRQPQLTAIESGQGGDVPSTQSVAAGLGVAPDTGAMLPSEVRVKQQKDQQALTQSDAVTKFMQRQTAGGQPGAPEPVQGTPTGVSGLGVEPPFEDPAARQNRIMGKLSGLDTTAGEHESPAHKVYADRQLKDEQAKYRPPQAAVQKELDAYKKARTLIPNLRKALMTQVLDQNDPTGQNANPLMMLGHMVKQRGRAMAYAAGYPLDDTSSQAAQLAGLMKIVGATPYLNGSRSMQMFDQVSQHLLDNKMSPEAQLQRLNELEKIFPQFEKEIGFQPGGQQAPPTTASGGPPVAIQGTPFPDAPAAAPVSPQAPAAVPPQASPVTPSRLQPGQPTTMAEITRRAKILNVDPKVMAAGLLAKGVKVTN